MPIWRARGSHPLSVTLRDAPSSAPEHLEQRVEVPVLVGGDPLAHRHHGARRQQGLHLVVAARRHHAHPAPGATGHRRREAPAAPTGRGARRGRTPGRTVAICTSERHRDGRHQAAPEGGLPRHQAAVLDAEPHGVAGEPGAEAGRRPGRHLAAPQRAGHQHGPRRRACAPVRQRPGHVLFHRRPRQRHGAVRAPRGQLGGVGQLGPDGHHRARHAAGDVHGLAQQLAGHAEPVGLDDHGHDRGIVRRRRRGSDRARRRRRARPCPSASAGGAPRGARWCTASSAPHCPQQLDGRLDLGGDVPRQHDPVAGHAPGTAPRPPPWGSPPRPRARARDRRRASRRMRAASTAARPSGGTLHGSVSRSAVDSTAGSATCTSRQPSSSSQRTSRTLVGQRQLLDPRREGEVEQLGDLGPDLAGVGVDRVAPHQDQVEGALPAQGRRPGPPPWPGCRTRRRRGR